MLEQVIVDAVVEESKEIGWSAYPIAFRGRRNAPDYLFIRNGVVLFIEFKAPGEVPRRAQVNFHKELRSQGVIVAVVDTLESGREVLNANTRGL